MDTKRKIILLEHSVSEFHSSRLDLAKFLINRNFEVHAILPNSDPNLINNISANNIRVHPINHKRNSFNILSTLNTIFSIFRIISKIQPEIIHSFKFQLNFYVTICSFFTKPKVVIHITGLGSLFVANLSFKKKIIKLFAKLIYYFNFLSADKIIFQNEDDINEFKLNKIFSKKAAIILGSGVNTTKYNKELYDIEKIKQSFDFTNDNILFTIVSRLTVEKGILLAIKSFEEITQYHKNFRLIIVGEIDNSNLNSIPIHYYQKYVNNNYIRFLGKRENINEILAISDVFLCPSYYREGIPRSSMEALATGLPIITTNMPGCKLTVLDKKNGILIKPNNLESFTNAVLDIYNLRPNWEKMGQLSRNLAISKFSNEKTYIQIAELYNYL